METVAKSSLRISLRITFGNREELALMLKQTAQRILTICWLIGFAVVLSFVLYKAPEYRYQIDDLISWLIQGFAPIGALIATVVIKDRKMPANAITSRWIFGLTLIVSIFYIFGLCNINTLNGQSSEGIHSTKATFSYSGTNRPGHSFPSGTPGTQCAWDLCLISSMKMAGSGNSHRLRQRPQPPR